MLTPGSLARIGRVNRGADLVALGYIQQVTSSYLVVTVGGGDVRVPMVAGTYTVGQFCLVVKARPSWWVSGPVTVTGIPVEESDPAKPITPPVTRNPPRPTPTKPKPAPQLTSHRWVTLTAATTGTYRSGWRTDTNDLFQGDYTGRGINTGFAGFGSKIKALRADLSRSRTVRVRFTRGSGGVYAPESPTVWTTVQGSKSGAPTRLTSTTGPSLSVGASGYVDLPATMRDQLLDGTARGVAVHVSSDSPYVRLSGSATRISVYYAPLP